MSWGYNGHHMINQGCALSFIPDMEQFSGWEMVLAEHASDADYRKDTDPNEGPRHYIDIDNYAEFISDGKIPQNYDSVIALYGPGFVIDQGTLPWATKIAYDSLVNSFIRFDWEKAVLFASDLGHYVGDGHQPLHLTRNYDGQFTGNEDIHSHYETGMINTYKSQIVISGYEISHITDVQDYIFDYIYANYIYVDSIMIADNYAQALTGSNTSSAYKAALWEKTKGFTIPLFNKAANTLAELIYSAWVDAGKPDMSSGPGIFEFIKKENVFKINISPNPVKNIVNVGFSLSDNSRTRVRLIDLYGNEIDVLLNENLPAGKNEFEFNISNQPEGIYFISIESGNRHEAKKIIKLNQ
jgi:hypothetical protein